MVETIPSWPLEMPKRLICLVAEPAMPGRTVPGWIAASLVPSGRWARSKAVHRKTTEPPSCQEV
jgi:hypothetical protein